MHRAVLSDIPGYYPYFADNAYEYRAFESLDELIKLAIEIKEKEDKDTNFIYFFRGEAACYTECKASLFTSGVISEGEHEYYQAALSSAPDYFYKLTSTFDRLSQMRHYSFPTRLLDITENILTAWFMALDAWKETPNDVFPCPRVIVFRVPKGRIKEAESDVVTNLSCLAKVKNKFGISTLWHEIQQERHDFHKKSFWNCLGDLFTNWCVRPRMTNTRVTDQQGAYILFGLSEEALNGRSLYGFEDPDFELNKTKGECARLFTCVDYEAEKQIAIQGYLMPAQSVLCKHQGIENFINHAKRELEIIGITPHTMYHDNFDKHADYWKQVIARRYSSNL